MTAVDIVALVLGMLTAGVGVGLLVVLTRAAREAAEVAPAPAPDPATPAPDPIRPGGRVLLEFSHPVAAVVGLACWFGFVYIRYQTFASIGFWALVVTAAAGLTLLAANARGGRHRGPRGDRRSAPPAAAVRLILLHGLGALVALTLTGLITFRVL